MDEPQQGELSHPVFYCILTWNGHEKRASGKGSSKK
jgi:hypothetical protein